MQNIFAAKMLQSHVARRMCVNIGNFAQSRDWANPEFAFNIIVRICIFVHIRVNGMVLSYSKLNGKENVEIVQN